MKEYTIEIFLNNNGTDANHRIVSSYHVEADDIGSAYDKAKEDFKNIGNFAGVGFILEGHYDFLPGFK